MDASKVPFITGRNPYSNTISHPRQYRPISTRPWTLSLYLAATGICFGLLLAINLVEKEPSPAVRKRDLPRPENRPGLARRQYDCTEYVTAMVTVCSPPSGYTCDGGITAGTTTYVEPQTTGSCFTSSLYETVIDSGSLLVLTSTEPTPVATTTAVAYATEADTDTTTEPVPDTSILLSLTSDTRTSTVVVYSTTTADSALLSLTSYSSYLTSTAASALLSLTSYSSYSTSTAASALLSLTSESSSDLPFITSSALLSLTSQNAADEIYVASTTDDQISIISQNSELVIVTSSSESAYLSLVSEPAVETSTSTKPIVAVESETSEYISLTSQISVLDTHQLVPTNTPTNTVTSSGESVSQSSTELHYTRIPTFLSASDTAITSNTASTITESTSTATSSTSATRGFQDPTPNENLVVIKVTFEHYYYFLAIYLPKIVAVIMASLWSVIFAGLKAMEPFYQLSAQNGAYAADTFFGNYLASEINLSSLSATFRGQWALLLGGAILIGWAAIVTFVSESMLVISLSDCPRSDGTWFRCNPAWAVNRPVLNALLGLLGFVFVLTLVLILLLSRRKRTGVYTDPSSIATMADLLGNLQVMEDLQGVKPSSSAREVKLFLGENRYKIGPYDAATGKEILSTSSQSGDERWGLIKLDQSLTARALARQQQADYGALLNPNIAAYEEIKANRRRRLILAVVDAFLLLTTLCVFALVLGYYLDGKSDPFNDFFNRGAFGPQFVLTSLSLILSLGWRRTTLDMAIMAPYRGMARAFQTRSGVMAARSILVPIARTPWTAFYKGIYFQQYMTTVAATCAILADLLLIAVSGVPYSSGQTIISLRVAIFTSLSILAIMIIGQVLVIFYNKAPAGGTRKLPRSPDTMIGVLLYLCHSRLVVKKAGFDDDRESPLNEAGLRAKYEGYQCAFAPVPGVDGVRRWTVDDVTTLLSTEGGLHAQSYDKFREHPAFRHGGLYDEQRPQHYDQQQPRPYEQRRPQAYEHQRQQHFEASATPIDNLYQNQTQNHHLRDFPPQNRPISGFQSLMYQQQQHYPNNIAFFEAQAKSPAEEIPQPRFEEMRPPRHVAAAQAPTQPRRLSTRVRAALLPEQQQQQSQANSRLEQSLAQWEYEQEFHNSRMISAPSIDPNRWTNDGSRRSRFLSR